MSKLAGKVAIITGAGRGIGRGIAHAFGRQEAAVVLASRTQSELDQVADELAAFDVETLALRTDVTVEEDVETLFAATMERYGRVDLLVNNAAVFDGGPLEDLTLEAWDRAMAVNLRGPFLCTREAFRIMKLQGEGRIINIGSISAQRVRVNSAPYSTSKHGIWGLTQVTALEGRDYGITCSCLHPGNVYVPRRDTERQEDDEPMMTVDEIAEVALLMAALPPHVEMLEAKVLPHRQLYVGRG